MPVAAPVTGSPCPSATAAARSCRRFRRDHGGPGRLSRGDGAQHPLLARPRPAASSSTMRPSATTRLRSQRPITSSSSDDDDDQRDAVLGELDDQAVDLVARADIDTLGRLVEEEDLRRAHQHPGEEELLLVAAGKMRDRRRGRTALTLSSRMARSAALSSFSRADHAAARQRSARLPMVMLAPNRQVEEEARRACGPR